MAFLLVHLLRPGVLVELGTLKGDSYCAFCQEVDTLELGTRCFAVDTWTGDPQTGYYGEEVLKELRLHHDPSYGSFSTLLRMTFDEALPHFAENEIDLLHIDGHHTFESVSHDFESWLPKLSGRGVVVFHDTNERRDDFGVGKLWESISATYPSFELPYGHGLGVAAVGAEPDPRFLELVEVVTGGPSEATDFLFALGERVAARGRVSLLSTELDEVRKALVETRDAVAQRDGQLGETRAGFAEEVVQLKADNLALEAELAAAMSSVSWRLTEPLRRAKAGVRRLDPDERTILRVARTLQQRRGRAPQKEDGRAHAPRIVSRAGRPIPTRPLVSIVMPTWNTEPDLLSRTVSSVSCQTYVNWELCICDDGSTRTETRTRLRQLAAEDERISITFSETNMGISAASNEALRLASGEFVAFLDHDDLLDTEALYEFVALVNELPDADVIYSDEDKIDVHGNRSEPFFKPDWSPEYFRGVMYVGHLLMIRRTLIDAVGGFDSRFDGVQDFELMLRVSERTHRIEHLPLVLYHWRKTPGSIASAPDAKSGIGELQADAVQAQLDRTGIQAVVSPHTFLDHRAIVEPKPREDWPFVSIIIPTKNAPEHIGRCLSSIYNRTSYDHFEVVIVDNGTNDPRAATIIRRYPVKLIHFHEPFNFSRANNLGVEAAEGEHVVLLNNDTEIVDPDWLSQLVWHVELPRCGRGRPAAPLSQPDCPTRRHRSGHPGHRRPRTARRARLCRRIRRVARLHARGLCRDCRVHDHSPVLLPRSRRP